MQIRVTQPIRGKEKEVQQEGDGDYNKLALKPFVKRPAPLFAEMVGEKCFNWPKVNQTLRFLLPTLLIPTLPMHGTTTHSASKKGQMFSSISDALQHH